MCVNLPDDRTDCVTCVFQPVGEERESGEDGAENSDGNASLQPGSFDWLTLNLLSNTPTVI